ncbi:sensor histidine kinase [Anaeromyxobacter oryzae]|uniref:histidine kinase n=1 Tax=Anaeromyxobacter oryzae TaxID=2918170 RepID=A0ABN6MTW8_9BACT|nr:PAS domain-containing protein [Anaeromyxobacter oryzae]BDG03105.1 hypothetical protein AMOR_21010 [Anaeromyxobacter oryzae]
MPLLRLPPPPRLPAVAAYLVAVALPLLAAALAILLRQTAQSGPFLFFFPAVLGAAYVGGIGPGILATACSAVLANREVIIPAGIWSPHAALATVLFMLVSAALVVASASLRAGYAERAKHERRLRSLVAASAQVLWTRTAAGEVVEDSPSWRAFTGQRLEDWLGAGWLEAVHPEDRERARRAWESAVAARRPFELEYRLRRPDGTYTPTLARGVPVIGDDGAVLEWVGANTDLSEVKEAERAIRESEARLRRVLAAMPQLVVVVGPGGVEFANPQLLEFAGRSVDELGPAPLLALVHPEERARAEEEWARTLATGASATAEHRLRAADGSWRWFLVSAVPLEVEADRVARWFVACTDIQAQKETEEAKSQAIVARDVFMSVASHELKTPITSALLQVQQAERLLRRDAPSVEKVPERLAAAAASVSRLGGLVEALLDVSRIATGRLVLERARFDLSEAVREVTARFGDAARRSGSELEVSLAPGVVTEGDRLRIEQVVTNLLANALKYGAGTAVRVSLRREGTRAVVEVADGGIGIAPEDQARIFERFERAVPARHYGGLGLGLWIARQIVDASGGTIRVESAPGRGATFAVELPADAAAVAGTGRAAGG